MFQKEVLQLILFYSTLNQTDLIQVLFDSAFFETGKDLCSVNRSKVTNGICPFPNWLTSFYVDYPFKLNDDIRTYVFHTLSDSGRLTIELDKLIAQDPCISPYLKAKIRASYPYDTDDAQIDLIARCLRYAMKRPLVLAPIA